MISFTLLLWVARVSASKTPFQLAASTDSFGGSDGAWQAVQIGLGTPPQVINLLPVGLYQSIIYSTEICKAWNNTVCGAGGLFNASKSNTYDNESLAAYQPYGWSPEIGRSGLDTLTLLSAAGNGKGKIEVPQFGIGLKSLDSIKRPDSSDTLPPGLGHLSLSDIPYQTFGENDGISPDLNSSVIPGNLQLSGLIDSLSYGLHIGSRALKLPLSLWLGGYDASRVIGSVFSRPIVDKNHFQIDLLDIAFGVDGGNSPFPFTPKQGILPFTNPLTVSLDAGISHLHLPGRVCESLTQNLPVTFQPKHGVYLWNTSDPQYTRIVTSPSYISFTFQALKLSRGNLTIKVPFQLLNLTFFPPRTPTPTSYFPCFPESSPTLYSLGRAFLQAAFLGVNFSKKPAPEWYLAQAPGPNIAPSPCPVAFDQNITTGAANWSETWKNHWTLLADAATEPATTLHFATTPSPPATTPSPPATTPSPPATTPPTSVSSSGGFPISARIGTATASVSFAAFILAAFVICRQRRRQRTVQKRTGDQRQPATTIREPFELTQEGINEAPMSEPIELLTYPGPSHELPSDGELYEAPPAKSFH